jgi:hypothetical protein
VKRATRPNHATSGKRAKRYLPARPDAGQQSICLRRISPPEGCRMRIACGHKHQLHVLFLPLHNLIGIFVKDRPRAVDGSQQQQQVQVPCPAEVRQSCSLYLYQPVGTRKSMIDQDADRYTSLHVSRFHDTFCMPDPSSNILRLHLIAILFTWTWSLGSMSCTRSRCHR